MALSEQTDLARPAGKTAARLGALADLAGVRHKLALPVLLYFLAVLMPIGFPLGSISMTGVRLILIVMILPLSFRLLAGAYGKLLLTDILFFLHVGWMAIAMAINNPEQAIANTGSTGIEFLGGYVLGRAFIRSREDFIAMIRLVAFVVICLVPFAIYEALTGTAVILKMLNALPGVNSLTDISIGRRMGFDRVQMVFAHPIHFGLFCAIMLPLCWIGMEGIYSDLTRVIVTLAVGISGFSALSSGALMALFLQIGLIGWAFLFRNTHRRWTLLLALFAVLYVIIDLSSNRTPLMVFLSYATFSAHTAYWRTIIFDYGMQNIWANPIFGIGLNDWFRPRYMRSGSVDNFWLLTGMRYGIPGFAFLAIGYLHALWKIGRRDFDDDIVLWQFRRAWMFSFIGLTFTLCTVHVWHTLFSFVFFMFGTGMWLLTAEPARRSAALAPASAPSGRSVAPYRRSGLEAPARPLHPGYTRPGLSTERPATEVVHSRFGPPAQKPKRDP